MLRKIIALSVLLVSVLCVRGADFMLVNGKTPLSVNYDKSEKAVVNSAVEMFCADIKLVSGIDPIIGSSSMGGVVAGTLGTSSIIDAVIESNNILVDDIRGEWEAYKIVNIDNKTLAVIGSDSRGTAYGILELSRMAGVSPWVWWADVIPDLKKKVAIKEGFTKTDKPSVQYRGIFLNDEDWGLVPWSSKTFEPGKEGEIGPNTYSKIFELLLRLRANTLWPAMHEKTVPFFLIEGNKEAADKYGIVMGTSHCEPLMRNNAGEWARTNRGSFNFITNKDNIVEYWEERLGEVKESENFHTIGMRGVHDGKMEGVKTVKEYKDALTDVIACQRELLSKHINLDVTKVPQVIIPYKEVLEVYNAGLEVPDDVTLVWCDDNYGYLTRLSNEAERKRSGGSGVYYHLSYWGRPHDYLWLSSTSPAQIYNEMKKAWDYGARKLWIANVGDIKPAEYNTEFFLDLAWNIDMVSDSTVSEHLKAWTLREFGKYSSEIIFPVMSEYYSLAAMRKAEHMGWNQVEVSGVPNGRTPVIDTEFNPFMFGDEIKTRLDRYTKMENELKRFSEFVPKNRQAAFVQLVQYPVFSASLMNKKYLYAQKARLYAKYNLPVANAYAFMSDAAYKSIVLTTDYYNNEMMSGKWKGMMDMKPRNLFVFEPAKLPSNIDYDRENRLVTVWCENSDKPLEKNAVVNVPTFVKEADNKFFIALFSHNKKPVTWWKVVGAPSWLKYKKENTYLRDESKIVFSVNWNQIKTDKVNSTFTLVIGEDQYTLNVNAVKTGIDASGYEVSGAITLNAAEFSRASQVSAILGLGHSGNSISLAKSESIEFDVVTMTQAEAEIRVYMLPIQAVDAGGDVRVAISVDGEPESILSIKTPFRSETWKQSVLRGQAVVKLKHDFKMQGKHTVKITALDDNIVLDQFMIDFENQRKFYTIPN